MIKDVCVYKGAKITICEADPIDAKKRWEKAIGHLPAQEANQCHPKLIALIKQLGNSGKIFNTHQFNKEGKLPNKKAFYAFKPHVKIRAYGWYSQKHPRTFFISHYAYKNQKKLQKADEDRVASAWQKVEK